MALDKDNILVDLLRTSAEESAKLGLAVQSVSTRMESLEKAVSEHTAVMAAKNQMAAEAKKEELVDRKEAARNKDKSRRTFLETIKAVFSNTYMQIALCLIILGTAQQCGIVIPDKVPGISTFESASPKIPDIGE